MSVHCHKSMPHPDMTLNVARRRTSNQPTNLWNVLYFILHTEEKVPFDETGQQAYHRACTYFGAIRSSAFHRKLGYATQIDMKHYGVGPKGAKALSIPMIVRTYPTLANSTSSEPYDITTVKPL